MTRSDLIELLAERKNVPVTVADTIVLEIFDSIADTLIAGDRIEIRGFGSFEIREYAERTGRNPKSGSEVTVTAKKRPFFKVGKELKERILNSGAL
ncbi:MAG: integration host factor subunit beta [Desulfuromonadaceae bacterium]|nr:integration host factor subunit beta [Desulfuromonadaceae bacterium]MDD5106830.1 integration host factor subunit beta [Desulfuromonadaceae bacterium]